MKTCRVCKQSFTPFLSTAIVCSKECAESLAISKRLKAEKKTKIKEKRENKQKLDKLKSRKQWMKEAQTAFNAWVRLRDAGRPCISCGRHHEGQYHAGHYLSVGARPELRFEELNVHKQCSACNNYLSGNIVLYRKSLIEKIGLERVEWLEGHHPIKKYTIDELKAIKAVYGAKARMLKAAHE